MDQKILHPANCYARLWDRTEDEFRLSKESGVYKQVIVLDGKEILADVVRIGMVMIYFETKEGVVGKSVYSDNKWSFQKIYNQKEKKEVLYLFDSFKKQVRTGLFVLPSAIPEGER
jgi:hypothetical protein